jgi:hypothetical protein
MPLLTKKKLEKHFREKTIPGKNNSGKNDSEKKIVREMFHRKRNRYRGQMAERIADGEDLVGAQELNIMKKILIKDDDSATADRMIKQAQTEREKGKEGKVMAGLWQMIRMIKQAKTEREKSKVIAGLWQIA